MAVLIPFVRLNWIQPGARQAIVHPALLDRLGHLLGAGVGRDDPSEVGGQPQGGLTAPGRHVPRGATVRGQRGEVLEQVGRDAAWLSA